VTVADLDKKTVQDVSTWKLRFVVYVQTIS